jgi:perosamine synthetase
MNFSDDLASVPLFKADITELEKNEVMDVLNSGYLSNGPKLVEFERLIAEYVGVPYAIGVNSGTNALHLAVRALGLKRGDEVITSSFSFIASSNCLLMEGIRPVFVDIDPNTYNINPDLIEAKITSKTKAILPVDIFGLSVDMDKILEIAKKYNLPVLEDSCEALGALYKGQKVGKLSTISTFGFFPNKQITTGEGGMIVTSDKSLAEVCKSIRAHGRTELGGWLYHDKLGYNCKLDEMSAAMGLVQMKRIKSLLEKRRIVAEKYMKKLQDVEGIIFPHSPDYSTRSWFVFFVTFKKDIRKAVMDYLKESKIGCRDYFSPIHLQPLYRKELGCKEGDLPITEDISKRTLALPFYGNMEEEEIDYVVKKLREALQKYNNANKDLGIFKLKEGYC